MVVTIKGVTFTDDEYKIFREWKDEKFNDDSDPLWQKYQKYLKVTWDDIQYDDDDYDDYGRNQRNALPAFVRNQNEKRGRKRKEQEPEDLVSDIEEPKKKSTKTILDREIMKKLTSIEKKLTEKDESMELNARECSYLRDELHEALKETPYLSNESLLKCSFQVFQKIRNTESIQQDKFWQINRSIILKFAREYRSEIFRLLKDICEWRYDIPQLIGSVLKYGREGEKLLVTAKAMDAKATLLKDDAFKKTYNTQRWEETLEDIFVESSDDNRFYLELLMKYYLRGQKAQDLTFTIFQEKMRKKDFS